MRRVLLLDTKRTRGNRSQIIRAHPRQAPHFVFTGSTRQQKIGKAEKVREEGGGGTPLRHSLPLKNSSKVTYLERA